MTNIVMRRAAMTRILKNQKPLWMAARIPLLEVTPKVKRHMAKKKNPTEKETFKIEIIACLQSFQSLPYESIYRFTSCSTSFFASVINCNVYGQFSNAAGNLKNNFFQVKTVEFRKNK
jgi:hypothetical protein